MPRRVFPQLTSHKPATPGGAPGCWSWSWCEQDGAASGFQLSALPGKLQSSPTRRRAATETQAPPPLPSTNERNGRCWPRLLFHQWAQRQLVTPPPDDLAAALAGGGGKLCPEWEQPGFGVSGSASVSQGPASRGALGAALLTYTRPSVGKLLQTIPYSSPAGQAA